MHRPEFPYQVKVAMDSAQMCIDDSRHLPLGVRLLEAISTTVLWLAYLGVLSCAQSAALDDGRTAMHAHALAWSPSQAPGLGFDSFVAHLLCITLCGSSMLFLWARYNRLRFKGRDRRKAPPLVSEQQFAQHFGATREQIVTLRRARRLVMHHDADGRLTLVRYRRRVDVHG